MPEDVEQVDQSDMSLSRRDLMGSSAVVAAGAMGIGMMGAASAQDGPTDEISGTVEDTDGNAVDGATVVAVPHDESLDALVTMTDANGEYSFGIGDLHPNGNLYHVVARDGTQSDPLRSQQNYPFIAAMGEDAIPDSVVTRPDDSGTVSTTEYRGVQINSDDEWPSIGAEISSQTSGATSAEIYRNSDGVLMGQTDISSLSAGDTFTVDNVNLSANTDYNFVLYAGGSSWTGVFGGDSFPYTSSDGRLRIVAPADENGSIAGSAVTLKRIGDVGF